MTLSALPSSADTLTIAQCVDLALTHSPLVTAAEGNLRYSRGGFQIARAGLLPQANLLSGYGAQHNITQSSVSGGYSASAQAQQLILDFGKTGYKTVAAGRQWRASEADVLAARQSVALAAQTACIDLLAAQAAQQVSQEALAQTTAHLAQARTLFEAGRGVRYNVAKAEVDVANARIASLRATDAVRAGLLQLEATLGVRLGARFALADTLAANADTLGLDSAVATALAARPELIAARLRQDAAAAQLAAAHLARLPAISGSAGYGLQSADSADQWTQSWNVGVNLTLPLFLGGSLTGAITQARGSQAVAQALVVGLEQSVTTEVELQTSALGEARERLAAATEAVGLAQLALQLAQECYRAGSGSALEMSDSELALTNAKLARIQALADCATARARLAHAMGALNVASGR